eukprot:TRINITY_DN3956_c0_g1_i1.p1 TRINITY_DN3956_c0_g1~~TRINITY_DN3956_c0_g1_i1.p1  ORF type:complete len:272 (-),score=59.18 TRINITY_DN3956_c0_g1_i1:758-1573(-)
MNPTMAKRLGVKPELLMIGQPENGEQALDMVDKMIRSKACDVIVVDSVAALSPRMELEGDMGEAHVSLQARLMGQALRKMSHAHHESECILIFINQLRAKMASFGGFGQITEVTPGGNSLKYFASIRMRVSRTGYVNDKDVVVGAHTKVKVVKNKVAAPMTEAEFDIDFGGGIFGISKVGEIIDLGLKEGLIRKSGAFFYYGDDVIGQGREKAKAYLREHTELAAELEKTLRERLMSEGLSSSIAGEQLGEEGEEGEEAEDEENDQAVEGS